MGNNYVYRMDHDTGFAPNITYGICSLSGCKKNTVEKWVKKGSWVIGIGGKATGKPDKLIYAMQAEENLTCGEFRKKYPTKSRYLLPKYAGPHVLVSMNFYYFGDNAIDLPPHLENIIFDRQGCRRVSDEDIAKLQKYLSSKFNREKLGNPNNSKARKPRNIVCTNP